MFPSAEEEGRNCVCKWLEPHPAEICPAKMCTASLFHSNRCAGLAPNNSLMLSPSITPLPGAGSCSRDQPPPLLDWASVICYSMWLRSATWPEAQRLMQGRGKQGGCASPFMVWAPGSLPCSKGPSPCSCLYSWVNSTQMNSSVAPLGAASLQKSWELQRDQVMAVWPFRAFPPHWRLCVCREDVN